MDNIITILIGVAAILGTILAILLAFSNYQQYKSELILEEILVCLSDKFASYNNSTLKKYYLRSDSISVELEKYKYIYDHLQHYAKKINKTGYFCRLLRFLILLLIAISSVICLYIVSKENHFFYITFFLILDILLFLIIWQLFWFPLTNHLIPTIPESRYPSPEQLISPQEGFHIDGVNTIGYLPLRLFNAINIIQTYDLSAVNNPYSNEVYSSAIDKSKFNTLAIFTLPNTLKIIPKFSGKLCFYFNDGSKFKNEINDSNITIDSNGNKIIPILLPGNYNNLKIIRLFLEPIEKTNGKESININYQRIPNTFIWSPTIFSVLTSGRRPLTDIPFFEAEKIPGDEDSYY